MDNEYPLALYRDGSDFVWEGRATDMLVVADADERRAALAEGWRLVADYLAAKPAVPSEKTLLDASAKDIEAALPDLDLEALEALRADEKAGKTRKGVLAAIESAIDAKLAA